MNKNKIGLLILFNILFFSSISFPAISYECTIGQAVNGSNLEISIFIRSTGDPFKLGASAFRINVNSPNGLNITNVPTELIEGLWDNGNDPSNYSDQFNGRSVSDGWVSINIEKLATGFGVTVPNTSTLVGKMSIPINNSIENSGLAWRKSPSASPTQILDVNNTDITSSGVFTDPTDVPLPIELSSFTASTNQNAVDLKWQTKTEVGNYGFEVERKAINSGKEVGSWEKVGFVNGHGNSNSPKDYSLTDKNPSGGSKFIYRLKQIDNDGKFKYSDQVEIELVPNEFNLFQNYPNPFNPVTNIKFALPKAAKVTLLVYNLLGEKVSTLLNEDKEAGFYDIQFNASNFSSGVYIFRLTTEDFVQTKKMTLIK